LDKIPHGDSPDFLKIIVNFPVQYLGVYFADLNSPVEENMPIF
jgi:hypothetical protein